MSQEWNVQDPDKYLPPAIEPETEATIHEDGQEPSIDFAEINRLAIEVIHGKHGTGAARRASLGENADVVLSEVRRLRIQNGI